jgi:uncharacterized membrane protein YbhN (UPF0104 family)
MIAGSLRTSAASSKGFVLHLDFPAACAICGGLVAADMAARTFRLDLLLRGAGHRLGFGDIFVMNAFGDAAAAVTPMRLGGEAARGVALTYAGLPLAGIVPLLALEVAAYTVVVALAAVAAVWTMAPEWWAEVGPGMMGTARAGLPWLVLVLALGLLATRWARSSLPAAAVHRPRAAELARLARSLVAPVLWSVPLTLASAACRIAILPVLSLTLPAPPPLEVVALSSFALTYGQLFLPTPAGVGAVELAFVADATGDLGKGLGAVFFAWRAFTTFIPVLLGFSLAARWYGAPVLGAWRRRGQAVASAPAPDERESAPSGRTEPDARESP